MDAVVQVDPSLMSQLKKENKTPTWTDDCERVWETTIKHKVVVSWGVATTTNQFNLTQMHDRAASQPSSPKYRQSTNTNAAENNCSSVKLECGCVIWAAKRWKGNINTAPNTQNCHGLLAIPTTQGQQFIIGPAMHCVFPQWQRKHCRLPELPK